MKKHVSYLILGLLFGLIAIIQGCEVLKNINTESQDFQMIKNYTLWQLGKRLDVEIQSNDNNIKVAKKMTIADFERKFWKPADSCVVKFYYKKVSADSMLVTFDLQRFQRQK